MSTAINYLTKEVFADICTGCGLCSLCCPRQCISMDADIKEGFLYPTIIADTCIKCGTCSSVCASNNLPKLFQNESKNCYASWAKDDELRIQSSSGGMFSVFAKYVLNECMGIVCGANQNDLTMELKHICITEEKDLHKLRKSKYYQSQSYIEFDRIKNSLILGKTVLFCGTPCQVSALKTYLSNIPQENLYTIDFLCTGVVSQKVILSYIDDISKRNHSPVTHLSFRNKVPGKMWENSCCCCIKLSNGKTIRYHAPKGFFYKGYMEHILFRPACYKCQYTGTRRISDITIGDFWGIGKKYKFNYDISKGISLVLLNNKKGEFIFTKINKNIIYEPRDIEEAINNNLPLRHPPIRPKERDLFWEYLPQKGFISTIKRLYWKDYVKNFFKKLVIQIIGINNVRTLKKIILHEK